MTDAVAPSFKIKSVALPVQHGSWGLWLEPVLLGLIVAFTQSALWLSLAAFGVLLLHQPLKIAIKDFRKDKQYARTTYARLFALIYAKVAFGFFIVAVITSDHPFYIPLLIAIPIGIFQFSRELENQNREMLAEVAGAVVFGATVAMIAQIDGWSLTDSMILWGVMAARSVPAILYVRARIRLEKDRPTSPLAAIISHIAGLGFVLFSGTPWLAVIAAIGLLARTIHGLSPYRKPSPVKVIGYQEMAFGLIYVILVGIGYQAGL